MKGLGRRRDRRPTSSGPATVPEPDDPAGRTPLHYAALEDRVEEVRELLASGADPSAADAQGFTPLHFAAQQQCLEPARLLVRAGADVDRANVFGNGPLLTAVFDSRGSSDLVELLLEAGADPGRENASGVSPRRLAETMGDERLQQLLG